MTQQIPEGLIAWYKHVREQKPADSGKLFSNELVTSELGGYTICALYRQGERIADGAQPVSTGMAFCNPKDHYNKKIGRAIALGRALKHLEEKNAAHA